MAHIENDSALAGLEQVGVHLSRVVQHRNRAQVGVRGDVAGPQLLHHQILKRPLGAERAEVHHHRNVRRCAGLHRALDGGPLRAGEMRGLDSNHRVFVLLGLIGCSGRVHIVHVLLDGPAAHAVAHDIQQRQHARFGAIDDAIFEIRKIAPAGAAGVDDRGHTAAKGEPVGIDAAVAGIGAALACARVDVNVNIDQSRGHVESGDIHHLVGFGRVDRGRHLGDFSVLDRDIANGVDLVLSVDYVAALQQQIVILRQGATQRQNQAYPEL